MQAKTLLGGFLFLVFVVSLYVLENSANLNQQKVGTYIIMERFTMYDDLIRYFTKY